MWDTIEDIIHDAVIEVCGGNSSIADEIRSLQKSNHVSTLKGSKQRGDHQTKSAHHIFWYFYRKQHRQDNAQGAESVVSYDDCESESRVKLVSSLGVERVMTAIETANLLLQVIESLIEKQPQPKLLASAFLATETSSTILLVSSAFLDQQRLNGRVPCPRCGKIVIGTRGLEWHEKNAHGVESHSEAFQSALAASSALMKHSNPTNDAGYSAVASYMLDPKDVTTAQTSPEVLAQYIREGRVKSLGKGFDACRCGDRRGLEAAMAAGFNPLIEVDGKGASCMLWAAGGGHLDLCRYLSDEVGLDPNPDCGSDLSIQRGRRGYNGRTALHYAARNGHIDVVRWLVEEKGCDIDRGTEDGTTAFCWAVWQNHLKVCEYLLSDLHPLPCDVHKCNSYGCNAAMWACQGSADLNLVQFLQSKGVSFDLLNKHGQGCLHKAAQVAYPYISLVISAL